MGLHIDLEKVYERNFKRKQDWEKGKGDFLFKYGLMINSGDNPTKKVIENKKRENIRLFGLDFDYYSKLQPPKAKTKDWLKVLTVDQIMRDKNRFSVSQKIHQLKILKRALKKKLAALLRFQVYK